MLHTPFFPPWRSRLAAFGRRVEHVRQQSLLHLELLFAELVPPGLLAQADEGTNSRDRVYSVRRTFWGFLYQALNPSCPCREIVRQIQALFCLDHRGGVDEGTSAYCQARLRLPLDRLQRIRHTVAGRADRRLAEAQQLWHGLRPKVIDATTVTLPDTPKNQGTYPQSRAQKPGCGFPLLRMVGIFSLSSGVLLDYQKGNKHQSDLALLHQLLHHFKPRDLVIADRGFCNFVLLAMLCGRGVGSLFRLHQSRHIDWRKGKRLGKNDRLFTWAKPLTRPRYLPHSLWKSVPAELKVRVLRFQLKVRGFRPESVTLATTLLDAKVYPAAHVAQLYARRWNIELWFRDIKTSLGMEVLHCKSPQMVHPTRKSEVFSTAADSQTSVEIKVYQGERALAKDNRMLGVFQLIGIPPAPRGIPQVEVTFDIDANGILNVTAKDKATNNEQKITITSSSGLSKDEVDKMAKDAESHAAEDNRRKDEIDARNRADSMVYQVEKMLKEHRDKISEDDAKNVEAALEGTRKAMGGGSVEEISKATDNLTQASHKLAEAMYKSTSGGPGGEPPAGGAGASGAGEKPKDNVVDAEFVDVDEKK